MIAPIAAQAGKANISPGASVTRAFGTNLAVGNLVVVGAIAYKTATDPFIAADCTKSAGTATIGAFQLDGQVEVADGDGGFICLGVWSAIVTGAGSLTVAVATGSASNYCLLITEPYTGSFDASRLDGTAVSAATGTNNQTAVASGNKTTTGAGMLLGLVGVSTSTSGFTMTQDAAYTEIATETDGTTNMVGEAIRRIVASSTTDSADWTLAGTGNSGWAALQVAYKEAAGGSASNAPRAMHNYRQRRAA